MTRSVKTAAEVISFGCIGIALLAAFMSFMSVGGVDGDLRIPSFIDSVTLGLVGLAVLELVRIRQALESSRTTSQETRSAEPSSNPQGTVVTAELADANPSEPPIQRKTKPRNISITPMK